MKRNTTASQEAAPQAPQDAQPGWFEVDVLGMRKTLKRNGMAWIIHELVQNAWDEDTTEVAVTLTEPKDGVSTLTCRDNSSRGYADLSTAYKMFAPSYKKADPTKRGRFNIGEKNVVTMCNEARIKSTSGTVVFHPDFTHSTSPEKTTVGSEFTGVMPLTAEEYAAMCKAVQRIFPPVKTIFNGVEIPARKPIHTFKFTLPTLIADEDGVLFETKRKTEVNLYNNRPGEKATLYERGLPVVEFDEANGVKWHVDVQQKVPLNTERDNVRPSYYRAVYAAVVNEMFNHFEKEEVAKPYVQQAMADKRVSTQARKTLLHKQYGDKPALESRKDVGSNKEVVSQGYTLFPNGR